MTHLYIEQNNSVTEEVNSTIISKLYELAISGNLDETSDLKGRLHSVNGFETSVNYLNTNFEDLYITVDDKYVNFLDPEILRILTYRWGDGVGVTMSQMASHDTLPTYEDNNPKFYSNTNITTFSDLGRFTSIKKIDWGAFQNTSNLTSIDLSNIEYIGWIAFSGSGLTGVLNLPSVKVIGMMYLGQTGQNGACFYNCTELTQVNCGQYLTHVYNNTFYGCTALQSVTGLSNVLVFGYSVFENCSSLESVDMNSDKHITNRMFYNCRNLTTIGTWINDAVSVSKESFNDCLNLEFPNELNVTFQQYLVNGNFNIDDNYLTFYNCKKLKKVILLGNNIQLGASVFKGCTSLTEIINTDKIMWIGEGCFSNCPISGTLDLSGCVGTSQRNTGAVNPHPGILMFYDMPNVTKIILGSWNSSINASLWITYDYYRAFVCNCPNLTTLDFGILNVPFPNYRVPGLNRSSLFCDCPNMTTLIIRNTSVVSLAVNDIVDPLDIGGSNVTLYVPDAIVNDYKTATGWSNIANQIKGISELPS